MRIKITRGSKSNGYVKNYKNRTYGIECNYAKMRNRNYAKNTSIICILPYPDRMEIIFLHIYFTYYRNYVLYRTLSHRFYNY